jgi:hypothetical protein
MKYIRKGVKNLQNTQSRLSMDKVREKLFQFYERYFSMFSIYLPSNSFYANQSTDEVLENIESDIVNKYSGKGNIILCGDLNARTGSESDFIQDDSNDENLPLYKNYNSDIVQEKRCSHDSKVDNRDKQLLDLCIGSKLPFLNGRMWGDSYGKSTCIKPSGSSVVDYVIMSENLLENTLYFQVSDFIPTLSDCHCRLSFGLLASYFVDTSQNDNINRSIFPGRYIWSASIGQKLCDTLTRADAKCNIKKFLDNDFTLTSEGIEKAVYECHEIIKNAVKKTAVLKKTEKKRKPKNKNLF